MSISQIAETLHAHLQNGTLELTDSTIAALPLGKLFSLLESNGIVFNQAEIATTETSVSLTGIVSLLGASTIALEATFGEIEGATTFSLSAKHLPTCRIPGASWLDLRDGQLVLQLANGDITGSIGGTLRVGDSDISTVLLVGKVENEVVLHWTIVDIDLSAIAQTFLGDVALPAEIPIATFKDVEMVVKPAIRTFSFQAMSAQALNFPVSGNGLSVTETTIAMSRVVVEADGHSTSQMNCAIALSGTNTFAISDEFALNQFHLEFNLQGADWSLSGDVEAEVFEHTLTLAAEYHQTGGERSLMLSTTADPAVELVTVDSVGHLSISSFAVEWSKQRGNPSLTGSINESESSVWSVSATGAIAITDVIDAQGSLTLARQVDNVISLVFKPDHARVHIPLPPDNTASVDWDFGDIAIVRQPSQNLANPKPEWSFTAEVDLSFNRWNPTVQHYLADTVKTIFKADRTGVSLVADRVLKPVDFAIPDVELSANTRVELGAASIDVTDMRIQLGKEIEFSAQLGIGLPAKLNNLFGMKADGKPSVEFFNTFDPSDRENSVIKAELSIGTAGITIVPTSSIIKAIRLANEQGELLQPGQDPWWFCILGTNGEFGEVKFKVPELSYDTANSSFKASGAFETIKPLALPLTPIKLLLAAAKMPGAAAAIPDSLPFRGINILDDHDNFNVDALIAELGTVGATLPAEVKTALKTIGDRLDHLPDSFKQYLNIKIPQSFAFDIAVTPEGTVRFDARVKEGDPPIKLLFPGTMITPVGPVPVLNGVSLRSLSFGELAGGSLFLLQVDATFDQFDLLTLATSLALPDSGISVLPSTRTLHRRLVLKNLFSVIVYETVIPIPIPLFYDQVGVEYLGLEGLEVGAHAQFPMPTFDLAEAGKLLSNFKQFFTTTDPKDPHYLLDPNTPPEHLNLTFDLKQNFLQLPPYLGGNLLGDRQTGPEINAYSSLAQLLNGMKTLSLNKLIQAMPLEDRTGTVGVAFGPFSSSIGWLVTTPQEFVQIASQPTQKQLAYQALKLGNDAQAASMLTVLPPPPVGIPDEQGMVVFLKGTCAVNNLASFETVFGLAASASMGFNTGFSMTGNISNVLSMGIKGQVAIKGQSSTDAPSFRLQGQSIVMLLNQPMFTGDVQISDRRFQCRGTLNLFGLGGSVSMLIDQTQGADMRGDLNAIDLGVFKLSGINGNPKPGVIVQIKPNQLPTIDVSGAVQLLGLRSETHISVADSGFLFTTTGSLFSKFSATLTVTGKRLNNSPDFHVSATMQNDLRQFLKTEATKVIQQSAADAQAKISAQQKQVDDAQAKVNSLNQQIDTQRRVVQAERDSANQGLADARAKVTNAQNSVNSLNRQIDDKKREISNTPKYRLDKLAKLGTELTGLYTALGTATGALKVAQEFLDKVAGKIVNTPIDLDPRVSGLISSRDFATGVLQGYKQTLELTKRGVAAGASAGDYIAQHGLDAVLAVNAASFDADLNSAAGGQVTMRVNLAYKGTPSNLLLNFNFNDPLTSAKALGQQLLSL